MSQPKNEDVIVLSVEFSIKALIFRCLMLRYKRKQYSRSVINARTFAFIQECASNMQLGYGYAMKFLKIKLLFVIMKAIHNAQNCRWKWSNCVIEKSVTKSRRLKCAIFLLPDIIFLLPYYARLLCNPFPCLQINLTTQYFSILSNFAVQAKYKKRIQEQYNIFKWNKESYVLQTFIYYTPYKYLLFIKLV